jgi:glycosyltransferase involved in cell wall biosynthesis
MKILIISEFFPTGGKLEFTGGVEARNYFVAKYLAKKHDVTVLTTRLVGSKKQEIISKISIIRVGGSTSYKANTSAIIPRINFMRQAILIGSEIKPDIVEGTNFITHFAALRIAKKINIPSVAWYPDVWIGSWLKNAGAIGVLGEILERYNLSQKFNVYIAISHQTELKLKKYAKNKIIVIACGVDPAEFSSLVKKPKTRKVLTVARLVKYKNVKDLILAIALLNKEGEKVKLTVIGRGPEEKSLKQLVCQLKLDESVEFKSNLTRSDLITEIKSSSIFCLPSSVEGFGITILETAAYGIPSVLADIPVFEEVTMGWQGSVKFPVNNISKLSTQLRKLIENKKMYEAKSKEAKLLARKYSWEDIAQKTQKVYQSALETK